jgi:hypothetical protein
VSASTIRRACVAGPDLWRGFVWKAGKLTLGAGEVNRGRRAIVEPVQLRLTVLAAVAAALATAGASTAVGAPPKTPAQVVRAWSHALNAGDDRSAGALFAPNAIAIQGTFAVRLRTAKSAVLWNSGLPCAGEITRLQVKGNVATATFRLGPRKGHKCDGPGQLVAARFTVVRGRITRWEQVAPESSGPIA